MKQGSNINNVFRYLHGDAKRCDIKYTTDNENCVTQSVTFEAFDHNEETGHIFYQTLIPHQRKNDKICTKHMHFSSNPDIQHSGDLELEFMQHCKTDYLLQNAVSG